MSPRLGRAFWAKALTTGAILTLVLMRVDLSTAGATLSHVELPLFLTAVSIALPLGFTGVQRWRTVAATFGESLPLPKAFMYAWIGQFINLGLPTVLGLDSVRAWKLHKQGLSIGLATRIVVVDRLCSMFTLLIIIALGMPHLSRLHGSEIFKHSAILAFVLGSAGLAVVSAAQLGGRIIPAKSRARHLYQLSKDFNHTLFGNTAATIKMFSWSTCNHLCRVAIVLCLALALGMWISPLDAFTLVPSALLMGMVPISLAGWGVREVVFIQAFSLTGVAPSHALALSLLYGLVGLVTGLFGGAVWLAERRLHKPPIAPSPSERHA
jgi:glycosyltransferase 2 family protein